MGARDYYPDYTYDDYAQWEGDWELIDGQAWAMAPAPSVEHQSLSLAIAQVLKSALKHCRHCKALMEVDYKVDEYTTLRPDVLVACGIERGALYVDETPEIVVEVLSPSTADKDRKVKFAIYRDNGVKYYVMVDPSRENVEVYRLESGEYVLVHEGKEFETTFLFDECSIVFDSSAIWEE